MGAWHGRKMGEAEVRRVLVCSRKRLAQLGFDDTLAFSRTSTFNVTFWSLPPEEAAMPVCLALHRHAHSLSHLPSVSGARIGGKAQEPLIGHDLL